MVNTTADIELDYIKIHEWEGWCRNNTYNVINGMMKNGNGAVVFVSEDKITELEILGLEKLANDIAKTCEGLDMHVFITQAQYHKATDAIAVFNFGLPIIENASEKCVIPQQKSLLEQSYNVLCVYCFNSARWRKSRLWRLFHRRQCHVNTFYPFL